MTHLAQEIRNAFTNRSRDSLELALRKVEVLEKIAPKGIALVCSQCGANRLDSPCPMKDMQQCPGTGSAIK